MNDDAFSPPGMTPALSIVTICFNAKESIGRTIESVQAQSFSDLEHLFVDGGSTDGTLDLIRARMRPQDRLISEPDEGISDALNKGVAHARGRAVQFLHADDAIPPDFAAKAMDALADDSVAFVYGDLVMERGGEASFNYAGEPDYAHIIPRRMPNINHPTCVVRREVFDAVGPFDTAYRCAMDYDWFLRAARKGVYGRHVRGLTAYMNLEGVSNRRFVDTASEVRRIAVANGRAPLVAWGEWAYRVGKVSVGQMVRAVSGPLYVRLRSLVNPTVRY
ncbi:MAG: glycosyltransferase [Caulobacterales bacterium]|nr:glycosyltransferase [Caulobacterales bacterium]